MTSDGLPAGVNARDAVDLVDYMEHMARRREWEYRLESMTRWSRAIGGREHSHPLHGSIVENYIMGRIDAETLIEQVDALAPHELPPVEDD